MLSEFIPHALCGLYKSLILRHLNTYCGYHNARAVLHVHTSSIIAARALRLPHYTIGSLLGLPQLTRLVNYLFNCA